MKRRRKSCNRVSLPPHRRPFQALAVIQQEQLPSTDLSTYRATPSRPPYNPPLYLLPTRVSTSPLHAALISQMAPRSTRRAQQAAKDARQLQQAAATAIATPAIPPLVAPAPPTTSTRRSKRRAPSPPRKPARSTTPADRLSPLSSELLALILSHLSPPASPDLPSLFAFSLVSRSLLPHVRTHMYRELRIDTRVNAHALHRTLHGNEVARVVRGVEADVGRMSKTSSQWVGESDLTLSLCTCSLLSVEGDGTAVAGGAPSNTERTKAELTSSLSLPALNRYDSTILHNPDDRDYQAGSSSTRSTPSAASSAPVARSSPSRSTYRRMLRRGPRACVGV